jgi:hypothetical protein
MGVAVAGEAPRQEAGAGQHEDSADDVPLLALDLALKLQTDHSDQATENQRGQNVAARSQDADPRRPSERPSLGSRHDGDRSPVVWKDRMQDADSRRREQDQEGLRLHRSAGRS